MHNAAYEEGRIKDRRWQVLAFKKSQQPRNFTGLIMHFSCQYKSYFIALSTRRDVESFCDMRENLS